jgi:DNA-binding MarR family transcriptional regulator
MPLDPDPGEVLNALHKRRDILQALSGNSLTQTELSDRLPISRPTVSRAISTFEAHGIVKRSDSGYLLSEFGSRVLDRDQEYVSDLKALCQRATILDHSSELLALDATLFEDADVFFSRPNAPDSACYAHADLISNANIVRSALGGIFTIFLTEHVEQVRTRRQEVTLMVPPDLATSITNAYPDLLSELSQYDEFRLLEIDRPVPITVTYVETPTNEYAIVLVHDDGKVVSSFRNDHPDAVKWARSWLDDFQTAGAELVLDTP